MSAEICPTVTAADPSEYRQQVERLAMFARRIHIDVADGILAPRKLVDINNVWWPGGMRADLHVMYKQPLEHLDALVALGPQLVILHAEADGDFVMFAQKLHHHGIETGMALLPQTTVVSIEPGLEFIDHVLIFSGNLGYQGGSAADMSLLEKVKQVKALKPNLEIGWDGGIDEQNAHQLAEAGVDVLNVGGFIHTANNPHEAYQKLVSQL